MNSKPLHGIVENDIRMEYTANDWPEVSGRYLEPTEFLDHNVPSVRAFAERAVQGASGERERAVRLFYAVRDEIRYDPYAFSPDRSDYRASTVLAAGHGYCLSKAIVLAAVARAVGIPAAIGTSDVQNHLNTEKLRQRMGGRDVFMHHGYAVLHVDGQWLKAAPAFNIQLCQRFGVRPTEFDGRTHAVLQEYDTAQRRHMEYLRDNGVWSDFPFDTIMRDFAEYYPTTLFSELGKGDDQADKFSEPDA